jgi:hypothetical protein
MVLNTGLDTFFDNIQDWKGIQGKAEEVNITKADVKMLGLPFQFSTDITLIT